MDKDEEQVIENSFGYIDDEIREILSQMKENLQAAIQQEDGEDTNNSETN